MSYRDADGRLHREHIDADAYVASIHFRVGQQSCASCHQGDYTSFPHASQNPLPTCVSCHEDLQAEYQGIGGMMGQSVHGPSGADLGCASCHSPHSMRPAREMTIAQRNAACVDCHEKQFNPSGLTLAERHAWHPQAALHLDRISCISCHTHPEGDDYAFRHDIRPKEEATSDCYACHSEDTKMASYVGSFQNGESPSGTCDDVGRMWYVPGAACEANLNVVGLALMGLILLGTAGHGTLRWAVKRGRRA